MKLVILGGGESGVGAALLGKKLGYRVFLSDRGKLAESYRVTLQKENIEFEEGEHTEGRIFEADIVVKSPGIPDTLPMIVSLRKKGIEVVSEIEFAGRNSSAQYICITGSNGKTTTTLLTHHILNRAGIDVGLAGNVGHSLAAQVAEDAHQVYVVELSSFQLDGMFRFRSDIAVLTNITPDHLDRYEHKFENYINSKFRILNNMRSENLFIYGLDSKSLMEKFDTLSIVPEKAGFTYGGKCEDSKAWMENDIVNVCLSDRSFQIHKDEITIKGRHNVYNAMAAILVCLKMGLNNTQIEDGLKTFPQVEHRLETVCMKNRVIYINDSKATNVDSAWYALDSMTHPVVWLAGGTDKGNDYSVLFDLVRKKVKTLICMGLDNAKLIQKFSPLCRVVDTRSLEEAMKAVQQYAEAGDVVLLSPCCASFDLFKNYEERGRLFKEAVQKL